MLKRLLALAAGFMLATAAEAALHLSRAYAQTYNPHIRSADYLHTAAPIWHGLYVGGHLGVGWGAVGTSDMSGSIDLAGFAGGLHGGYNFQRGNLLLGIEADGSWSGADDQSSVGTLTATVSNPWLASIRGRLGIVHDRWLVYLTGGVAFGELNVHVRDADPLFPLDVRASESSTGYVFGSGLERKLWDRYSARAEVLRYSFGDFGSAGGAGKVDLEMTVVRAGMSVHMQ